MAAQFPAKDRIQVRVRSYDYVHRQGVEEISWERFAREVVTARLAADTWANPRPQVVALVSDALVVFPWDRRVYEHGQWRQHPEIQAARSLQRPADTEKGPENPV